MVTKTFDPTQFQKTLTGKMNIPVGFSDPKIWISSGNYGLNRLISGDYKRGVPLGKVTMFAGESGSGKSLIAANTMVNAQKQGVFVLLLDTESAGDKQWYEKAGVDTDPDKFMRVPVFTVSTVTQVVAEFIKNFTAQGSDQPILIVVDSLGMLETETGQEGFLKGHNKGDQGQLAKQLKKFVKNCMYLVEQKDIGFLMTNHTYDSQDMFNPDQKVSGGAGIVYASSIVIATRKGKLKDVHSDKEVETSTGVHGVKINAMVYKSRYNKPFEKMTIDIPWSQGVDPYSGLIELFELDGTVTKVGNMLQYTTKDGEIIKQFRKNWKPEMLDILMEENPYMVTVEDIAEATSRDIELEDIEIEG